MGSESVEEWDNVGNNGKLWCKEIRDLRGGLIPLISSLISIGYIGSMRILVRFFIRFYNDFNGLLRHENCDSF